VVKQLVDVRPVPHGLAHHRWIPDVDKISAFEIEKGRVPSAHTAGGVPSLGLYDAEGALHLLGNGSMFLKIIGILIIISALITSGLLFIKIVKLEKEILAEKNERTDEADDSLP
jgi:hypothetical protein